MILKILSWFGISTNEELSFKGWAKDACEDIDIGFSTGTFNDKRSIKEMEYYLGRWNKEFKKINYNIRG